MSEKRTIFDIRSDIAAMLDDAVDPETGELVDIDMDAFNALQIEEQTKIEHLLLYIKNTEAFIDACKQEERKMADKRKAAEAKADRLKSFAEMLLQGSKFNTPSVTVSYRKSESINIDDAKRLYAWAKRNKLNRVLFKHPEPQPDKTAIKAYLKNGANVPWISCISKQNMSIK